MSSTQGTTDRSGAFIRFSKLAGLALLGAGLFLGGCNGKLKEENEALTKENAELREAKTAAETQRSGLEQRVAALQNENANLSQQAAMGRQFEPPMAGGGGHMPARQRDSQRTIELSGDVLFASGSVTLKADAKRELDKLISELRNAHEIVIEGHTDSDPVRKSKFKSNEALSKARADSVRDYLASRGVSKSKISTVGKGSSEPRETKAKSRRVDIVVVE